MAKLFAQEVPEVYDGVIEIRAVARDLGSCAKMAVVSNDSSIDPVGACVGTRFARAGRGGRAAGREDRHHPVELDEATFIVNALAPAGVSVAADEEDEARVEVVVPDEQLPLAIGRRGQNVRSASQPTGWQIDIMTESQESERRQRASSPSAPSSSRKPWTWTRHAQAAGHRGLRHGGRRCLCRRLGNRLHRRLDEDTAEIQARATDFLADMIAAEFDAKRVELGVEDGLPGDRGRDASDRRGARRGRGEDRRGPGSISSPTTCAAGSRPRTASGFVRPASWKPFVGRGRGADHARPRVMGWVEGAAGTRTEPEGDEASTTATSSPKPNLPAKPRTPKGPGILAVTPATLAAAERERRDIVTGEVMDEARLIRFVAGPGGNAPDPRKLPGRGSGSPRIAPRWKRRRRRARLPPPRPRSSAAGPRQSGGKPAEAPAFVGAGACAPGGRPYLLDLKGLGCDRSGQGCLAGIEGVRRRCGRPPQALGKTRKRSPRRRYSGSSTLPNWV